MGLEQAFETHEKAIREAPPPPHEPRRKNTVARTVEFMTSQCCGCHGVERREAASQGEQSGDAVAAPPEADDVLYAGDDARSFVGDVDGEDGDDDYATSCGSLDSEAWMLEQVHSHAKERTRYREGIGDSMVAHELPPHDRCNGEAGALTKFQTCLTKARTH